MLTIEIAWANRQPDDDLFPNEMDRDPTLVFHGTSSTRETSIDRDGLRPNSAGVSLAEIQSLVESFDLITWKGERPSGYSTLTAWTLRNDFRGGQDSPLYMSEQSSQALYFASKSLAGGEKLSAARAALADLHRYVHDPEYRAAAIANREQWDSPPPESASSPEILKEVGERLSRLAGLIQRADSEKAAYQYAVVYAVRPPATVRSTWEDCRGMGLRVLKPIPLDWIVAKLRIFPPTRLPQ